jgi:hypothetical protein
VHECDRNEGINELSIIWGKVDINESCENVHNLWHYLYFLYETPTAFYCKKCCQSEEKQLFCSGMEIIISYCEIRSVSNPIFLVEL